MPNRARSLERVGEWWSILLLRDAFHGLTRFDQFQNGLEIAPNMLTPRLAIRRSNIAIPLNPIWEALAP